MSGLNLRTLFWSVFWGTLVILAVLYVYANLKMAKLSMDDQGRVMVSERFYQEWQQTLPQIFVDMGLELDTAGQETERVISEHVDTAFAPVYQRIPAFLDFHYSLVGEYTELAAALADEAGADLKRILFDDVDFDHRLEDGIASIQRESDAILTAALESINATIRDKLDLNPSELVVLSSVVTLSMEDAMKRFEGGELMLKSAGAAAGAGAVAVVMTKTISKKMATKLAVKATTKAAVKAAGAGGGAATGAAAGVLCGPLAWICVPVGGLVSAVTFWVLTDKAIIEVDEHLNRETFEGEIRTAIDAEKARIKTQLSDLHKNRIQAILEDNEARLRQISTQQLIEEGG